MALRSAIGMLLAATLVVGCSGPSATASAPIGPSASVPGSSSQPPTTEPTGTPPAPTAGPTAGVGCPSDLPTTLASVDDLADPSCYGTTELTIEGWLAESGVWTEPGETEPGWTNPWTKLYARPPTAGEFMIDFLQADQVPGGIDVVTPPRTGIDLSGNGRWVTLRGHFNDPDASACEKVRKNGSDRDCAAFLVVTGLDARPFDSISCPSDPPFTIDVFLAAEARCFRGRDTRLIGWEDVGEGFGGTGPIWRVDESASLRTAEAQLAAQRFEDQEDEPYMFVWIEKGSGVRFDASDREVVVTVRLGHPAAADCRPESYDGWRWTPPVTWAQHYCERMLVITDVRGAD